MLSDEEESADEQEADIKAMEVEAEAEAAIDEEEPECEPANEAKAEPSPAKGNKQNEPSPRKGKTQNSLDFQAIDTTGNKRKKRVKVSKTYMQGKYMGEMIYQLN